eukprot:scaffold32287_cov18-Tisochrysis_lutea.AAC.1
MINQQAETSIKQASKPRSRISSIKNHQRQQKEEEKTTPTPNRARAVRQGSLASMLARDLPPEGHDAKSQRSGEQQLTRKHRCLTHTQAIAEGWLRSLKQQKQQCNGSA